MLVSSIAFKVSLTAMAILMVVMFADEANGTFNGRSPMWIAAPGAIAGLTFIAAGVIGFVAMVWGL